MSTMITFAANNEFFRKRKRVHKACDSCKKRRKRCVHTFDGEESGVNPASPTGNGAPNSQRNFPDEALVASSPLRTSNAPFDAQLAGVQELGQNIPRSNGPEDARPAAPPRFIGYLSPEAIMRGQLREPGNKCGGWVTATDDDVEAAPSNEEHVQSVSPGLTPSDRGSSTVERALQAYLDAVGVSTVPIERTVDALLGIYFEYVHPLLPLIDQRTFYSRHVAGEGSRMLLQAICLVSSRHEGAREHLYLSNDPNLLEPREYSRRLYAALVAGVNARLEKDRITLIQTLALMSLYSEGIDGADQASMHLVQAIHHAHTIGLQFSRQRKVAKDESMEKLFWCLWSLDKVNASVNGRPQYMHDRDNQLESMTAKPEQRRTPFGIWLQLASILDRVIELYRPGTDPSNTGLEVDFPGFEDIIGDGGDRLQGPIVAALELFYHAVAMLSHKSRSITDPVRSTPSSVRQSLSAYRVISILGHEFPCDLPPLPIVPYALALAMSVAYRQFRRSKLQGHKNRAKEDLKTCCSLLNKLRSTWWCAGCMADLGAAALNKADRAANKHAGAAASATSQQASTTGTGTGTQASQPFHADSRTPQPSSTTADPPAEQAQQSTPQDTTDPSTTTTVRSMLNASPSSVPAMLPGQLQHALNSERADQHTRPDSATTPYDFNESPDWLNFDNAFENMDTLLGSAGADLSSEMLRGFQWDEFGGFMNSG